jgi:hypothetical protein
MTLTLIPTEDVRTGDLMEDHDKVWRPVTHIDNQGSSAWFYFRVSQQGVRAAMRGCFVMVGRQYEEDKH